MNGAIAGLEQRRLERRWCPRGRLLLGAVESQRRSQVRLMSLSGLASWYSRTGGDLGQHPRLYSVGGAVAGLEQRRLERLLHTGSEGKSNSALVQ